MRLPVSNRPVHFELHADNPTRAAGFYSAVFRWQFIKWDGPMPYWIINTGEGTGIDGGMVMRRGPRPEEGAPVHGYVVTIDVADIDATITSLAQHGGSVALPKMPIPGVGWLAYFKDTEGNIFGVMQSDETAG
jgi:predicted enzyme related to lactoylglutathione lyase